jgi:hypothetical protein
MDDCDQIRSKATGLGWVVLVLGVASALASCGHGPHEPRDERVRELLEEHRPAARVDFEGDIRPILEARCLPCHGGVTPAAGVSLETRDALYAFSRRGPFVVPGEPMRSRLFRVIILADAEEGAMPPTGHALETGEIALLRNWIRQGARWDGEENAILRPLQGAEPRSR